MPINHASYQDWSKTDMHTSAMQEARPPNRHLYVFQDSTSAKRSAYLNRDPKIRSDFSRFRGQTKYSSEKNQV